MTTRVIVVRHGQSTYNAQQKIQGRTDESVLTDEGQRMARQVGAALQDVSFDAIYSSPLQRAKQTADIVHSCLGSSVPPPQTSPMLLEIDLPLWEKMTKSDVTEQFGAEYRIWKERPHEFKMTIDRDGETIDHYPVLALREQAEAFWQDILDRHRNETVMIVAHNGINRCLLSTALGIGADRYQSVQQSNCCINVLNFSGGLADSVQLESMNQIAHLGNPFPKPRPPHHGPRLLLVRHGETEWNRLSRFQGQIDIPLNENGREQGRKAAGLLESVALDFAVSSSMLRPKETAELILAHHPGIELELDSELVEISHGLWEGKLESEIRADYNDLLEQWKSAPETVQMPEGENLQQVWERSGKAWDAIVRAHSNADRPLTGIVVAHDAVNKAILCHLFGLEPDRFWNFKQGNGAVSVIDYPNGPDGAPVLEAMNITAHLASGVFDRTAAGAL
ncbi:MAG: histidine phosphatase family protein [Cyanobacteriota bacterium]|nr:histidine phosphatase family protein [Cyanobacteriota bacterium]